MIYKAKKDYLIQDKVNIIKEIFELEDNLSDYYTVKCNYKKDKEIFKYQKIEAKNPIVLRNVLRLKTKYFFNKSFLNINKRNNKHLLKYTIP